MRKIKYIIIFLLSCAASYCFMVRYPNALFEAEPSLVWNIARQILVMLLISIIVSAVFFAFFERATLYPYFYKLFKFRSLLYQLVRRDFKSKYKRSVLGIFWTVLSPLLMMLVMTIVFSTLFRFDIKNFPVYLLSGQIFFGLFSEATNMSMSSVLGASALIRKVAMPKYIFPVSRTISSLVNFAFSLLALFFVMLMTSAPFHWTIVLIIIPVLYTFIFSLGIGLILSAAAVFFRDVTYLWNIFITALSYLTPLFYPISIVPDKYRMIISLNPMYHFVEYFRTVAIYGNIPTLWQNMVCLLMAVVSLAIGLYIFYKKQDDFILYI